MTANLDLIIANGHPNDLVDKIKPQVTFREPLLLFHNTGTELRNVSPESGPLFAKADGQPRTGVWAISTMMARLMC